MIEKDGRIARQKTCIEDGKLLENGTELFVKRFLGELDLAHIEVAYTADFEVFVDDLHASPSICER